MKNYEESIVLTLDAGGTNMVFSAMQNYENVVDPIVISACTTDTALCLGSLLEGFRAVITELGDRKPVAISFAFPGPADYENGVIGDLPNFKAFRGGVALGPFLEKELNLPVYINNDGNLFAYGEALHGALPYVNKLLKESGNNKQYKNLIGLTLGTGFGCGVVINKELLTGDNGCGGDVWIFRNKKHPNYIVEESVSIRAIIRVYKELSGETDRNVTPKDIFDIAEGTLEGNAEAAKQSFRELGEMAGDAIAHLLTVADGIVVIGGGLTGAHKYILPSLLEEIRNDFAMFSGDKFPRVQMEPFNLDDEADKAKFLASKPCQVKIPNTDILVPYNKEKKTAIMLSTLGTNHAIMCGAYAYALEQLKNN